MDRSRRRFLQVGISSGLSAGAALASCSWPFDRKGAPPPGGFLGVDPQVGHLLRQKPPRSNPQRTERVDVAILGGGVSGLSAAWALSRSQVEDFVVLELDGAPGGTARSVDTPVSPHPLGAHYLPVPGQGAKALGVLLSDLGILTGYDAAGRAICGEEHICRAPQERIFYKGRWYEGLYLRAGASAEDLRQFSRFHDEVSALVRRKDAAGRRAFTLPQRAGVPRLAEELDRITMAQFLDERGFTSARLRWQVDYGCRDDFGMTLHHTSAWAALHYYVARLLHPDDTPPEVLTWPEGNGYLAGRLAQPLGSRLRTGRVILGLEPGADGVVIHSLDLSQGVTAPIPVLTVARQVIYALPVFLRRYLLPPSYTKDADYLDKFTYSPWLVANLTLRRAHPQPVHTGAGPGPRTMPGHPLCWDNVLYESSALGYVVAPHQREARLLPDGIPRTVWTYYLPYLGADPKAERQRLLSATHRDLAEQVLWDLRRAEPDLRADLERIDLTRFGHGMVRPVPGLICGGALQRAAASLIQDGIHFAHTDLSGMALFEEAHDAGVRAAEAAMAALSHTYHSLL